MRTNEERLIALHKRAAEMKKAARTRRVRLLQGAGSAGCVAVVLLLAAAMPGLSEQAPSGVAAAHMSGSIFSGGSSFSYIAIGIIAFLLGVALTLFCFQLKKWHKSKEDDGK